MDSADSNASWQPFTARVVQGHRVASGLNGNPRFPGGRLHMQTPVFLGLGVDLGRYHRGTLNVSLAPRRYEVIRAPLTLRQVKWHPTEPAEDFSFFELRCESPDGRTVEGCVYYPHPDTKPEHFQNPDVLELLLPTIAGIGYGMELQLAVRSDQMRIV